MVTAETLPAASSCWNAVNVGGVAGSDDDVTNRCATKASRITISIGNAALLKKRLSGQLPIDDVARG
jgi:hypothetical protein